MSKHTYRTKAEYIQAMQWDGTFFGTCEIEGEFEFTSLSKEYNVNRNEVSYWKIVSGLPVMPNDYIIKHPSGLIEVMNESTFLDEYEKA